MGRTIKGTNQSSIMSSCRVRSLWERAQYKFPAQAHLIMQDESKRKRYWGRSLAGSVFLSAEPNLGHKALFQLVCTRPIFQKSKE